MPRNAMTAADYKKNKKNKSVEEKTQVKEEVVKQVVYCVKEVEAYVHLVKVKNEEQKVTGIVLEPDTFDAQQTTIKSDVIRKAAHEFLSKYNLKTKIGLQHSDFKKPFELCESYIAPCDFTLGNKTIKSGSWLIVVKILDTKVWKSVKEGGITGFSIGGHAKIKRLEEGF